MIVFFLIYTFITLYLLKKFVLHTYRIFHHNSFILFLTCLTHHNLWSNYMDSVFESSFILKRFETKWETLLENYIGYDVRQKTFGNEKSSNVLDTIDTLP